MTTKSGKNDQFEKFEAFSSELTAAGKEQMEALAQSGTIAMKGFESIFRTYLSLAQGATEKNAQAYKKLVGCKTLNELTEAQSELTQGNLDEWIGDVAKISEQYVKVVTDSLEPLNNQVNKTVKKTSEAMAA